ncbi:MAG: hypothetical protein ACLUUE_05695 [Romboutsia timonensis]
MAEILISLFVYINLVNDDNKKFIIINLLTKEINQISSKKFDYSYLYNEAEGYYDLDELYKEVDTSLKVQKKNKIKKSLCYILSIICFYLGLLELYMKEDTLYTIRDDKVYIEGDGVDKVLDLNSPKSPIFFGYFFLY